MNNLLRNIYLSRKYLLYLYDEWKQCIGLMLKMCQKCENVYEERLIVFKMSHQFRRVFTLVELVEASRSYVSVWFVPYSVVGRTSEAAEVSSAGWQLLNFGHDFVVKDFKSFIRVFNVQIRDIRRGYLF